MPLVRLWCDLIPCELNGVIRMNSGVVAFISLVLIMRQCVWVHLATHCVRLLCLSCAYVRVRAPCRGEIDFQRPTRGLLQRSPPSRSPDDNIVYRSPSHYGSLLLTHMYPQFLHSAASLHQDPLDIQNYTLQSNHGFICTIIHSLISITQRTWSSLRRVILE